MAEADQDTGQDHADERGCKVRQFRKARSQPTRPVAVDGLISDPVMRVDKFLQLSRLVKRRAVAHTLCATGRVRINGSAAKPSTSVKTGDVITISRGDRRLVAKVVAVPDRLPQSIARVDILARIHLDDLRVSDLEVGR